MHLGGRVSVDPGIMGGKACVRGTRVTVGAIVGLLAARKSHKEILRLYPYITEEDLSAALAYAAWRAEEYEAVIG